MALSTAGAGAHTCELLQEILSRYTGHFPSLDNPVAYNAALMQFPSTHAAPVAAAFAS